MSEKAARVHFPAGKLRLIRAVLSGKHFVPSVIHRRTAWQAVDTFGRAHGKPFLPSNINWAVSVGALKRDDMGRLRPTPKAVFILESFGGKRAGTVEAVLARIEPDLNTGCWLWSGATNEHGYGSLSRDGKRYKAHRFFFEKLVGPIPPKTFLCHKCDTPACVNPAHMFFGHYLENNRDCREKGRIAVGARMPQTKLCEQDIIAIRKGGKSDAAFARMFGVNPATILSARRGATWKHVRLEDASTTGQG